MTEEERKQWVESVPRSLADIRTFEDLAARSYLDFREWMPSGLCEFVVITMFISGEVVKILIWSGIAFLLLKFISQELSLVGSLCVALTLSFSRRSRILKIVDTVEVVRRLIK